jgi:hypothetical protein
VRLQLRLYFASAFVLYGVFAVGILVVTVWLDIVTMGDYAARFQSPEKLQQMGLSALGLVMPLIPLALGFALASRRAGPLRYLLLGAILGAIVALPIPHLVLGPVMVVRVLRGAPGA